MSDLALIDRGSSGQYGWHGLSNYLDCMRKGRLHDAGYTGDEPEYFARGNLIHVGLAHLYARRMPGGPDRWLKPIAAVEEYAARRRDQSAYYAEWVNPVADMLRRYVQYYGREEKWTVLGVEEVITAEVETARGDVVPYTLRYDLAVRDHKGRVTVWDHKGTYAIIKKTTATYDLDGQMLGISRVGRAKWGKAFRGVRVNFIRLTKKGDVEFGRSSPMNTPQAVYDFPETVVLAHRLRGAAQGYAHPLDAPGRFGPACWNKYGPCPFREMCKFGRR